MYGTAALGLFRSKISQQNRGGCKGLQSRRPSRPPRATIEASWPSASCGKSDAIALAAALGDRTASSTTHSGFRRLSKVITRCSRVYWSPIFAELYNSVQYFPRSTGAPVSLRLASKFALATQVVKMSSVCEWIPFSDY